MDQESPEKMVPVLNRQKGGFMKKVLTLILCILFCFSTASFAIAGGKKDRQYRQQKRYQQRYRHDNGHHYGWRIPPGHQKRYYHYRGHWNSRKSWERYHRRHRYEHRNGRYYRDNRGSLIFRFCDDTACFSFSIRE
jgi:hypothetical protein